MARKPSPTFARVLSNFETVTDLANALGVKPQNIDYWLKIGYVPARWCLRVATITGGRVTVLELVQEAEREETRRTAERMARKAQRAAQQEPGA
jgi:DNA-binding transcriptional regulator YdaS (Cro superfamily)